MMEPIKGMKLALYPVGDMTQGFGENPTLYGPLGLKGHNGIDLVRPWGEHMFAVEDGTVVEVKTDPSGYGEHVRIINSECTRIWTYGHCSQIVVTLNQKVTGGQHIANMGNTGFVVSGETANGFWKANPYAGTHLHLGLRLIEKSRTGWAYEGTNIKFDVLNYGNGFKGSVDPVPYLRDQSLMSTKAESLSRKKNSKVFMQSAIALRKAGL